MTAQPSPEEAASALREAAGHRQRAAESDAHPAWLPWVLAALIVAAGLGTDLRPEWGTPLLYLLAGAAIVLTYLPRWKRAGSALGYQRAPVSRAAGAPLRPRLMRMLAMVGLIAVFAGLSLALRSWEVPFPATIGSVVIAATMPLWRRLLTRAGREPEAARG